MNQKIKEILEKHRIETNPKFIGVSDLNNAIIEICDEQIYQCAERASSSSFGRVNNTPNIAHPENTDYES